MVKRQTPEGEYYEQVPCGCACTDCIAEVKRIFPYKDPATVFEDCLEDQGLCEVIRVGQEGGLGEAQHSTGGHASQEDTFEDRVVLNLQGYTDDQFKDNESFDPSNITDKFPEERVNLMTGELEKVWWVMGNPLYRREIVVAASGRRRVQELDGEHFQGQGVDFHNIVSKSVLSKLCPKSLLLQSDVDKERQKRGLTAAGPSTPQRGLGAAGLPSQRGTSPVSAAKLSAAPQVPLWPQLGAGSKFALSRMPPVIPVTSSKAPILRPVIGAAARSLSAPPTPQPQSENLREAEPATPRTKPHTGATSSPQSLANSPAVASPPLQRRRIEGPESFSQVKLSVKPAAGLAHKSPFANLKADGTSQPDGAMVVNLGDLKGQPLDIIRSSSPTGDNASDVGSCPEHLKSVPKYERPFARFPMSDLMKGDNLVAALKAIRRAGTEARNEQHPSADKLADFDLDVTAISALQHENIVADLMQTVHNNVARSTKATKARLPPLQYHAVVCRTGLEDTHPRANTWRLHEFWKRVLPHQADQPPSDYNTVNANMHCSVFTEDHFKEDGKLMKTFRIFMVENVYKQLLIGGKPAQGDLLKVAASAVDAWETQPSWVGCAAVLHDARGLLQMIGPTPEFKKCSIQDFEVMVQGPLGRCIGANSTYYDTMSQATWAEAASEDCAWPEAKLAYENLQQWTPEIGDGEEPGTIPGTIDTALSSISSWRAGLRSTALKSTVEAELARVLVAMAESTGTDPSKMSTHERASAGRLIRRLRKANSLFSDVRVGVALHGLSAVNDDLKATESMSEFAAAVNALDDQKPDTLQAMKQFFDNRSTKIVLSDEPQKQIVREKVLGLCKAATSAWPPDKVFIAAAKNIRDNVDFNVEVPQSLDVQMEPEGEALTEDQQEEQALVRRLHQEHTEMVNTVLGLTLLSDMHLKVNELEAFGLSTDARVVAPGGDVTAKDLHKLFTVWETEKEKSQCVEPLIENNGSLEGFFNTCKRHIEDFGSCYIAHSLPEVIEAQSKLDALIKFSGDGWRQGVPAQCGYKTLVAKTQDTLQTLTSAELIAKIKALQQVLLFHAILS